ncbi:MAG: MxaD family protein [Acidobacteria bacterium]|nr:MAG: MxaD family protein [Acidobacteriota bacterium]
MASIRKEILLDARPDEVWDVVRDVGAVHTRFAPGFVVDTQLEPGARVVTFANGFVARELIVDVDDGARRLAYAAVGGRLAHHNASFTVVDGGGGATRLVWIADLLPNEMAPVIDGMMEQGAAAIRRALTPEGVSKQT